MLTCEARSWKSMSSVLQVPRRTAGGVFDLAPHKPTILRDIGLKLDPAAMLQVDEQRPGVIRAVLRSAAGDVLAESSKRSTSWPRTSGRLYRFNSRLKCWLRTCNPTPPPLHPC